MAMVLCGTAIPSSYANARGADGTDYKWKIGKWQDEDQDEEDVVLEDGALDWDDGEDWTDDEGWEDDYQDGVQAEQDDEDWNDGYYYDVPEDWEDDYDGWDEEQDDSYDGWDEEQDDDSYEDQEEDWEEDSHDNRVLAISDIAITPAKKTIKKGKSFYITYVPAKGSAYKKLSDQEWDEICNNNIQSISFKSKKSSIASVNKFTGKVKARKKGTVAINTTIKLGNGESMTCKTKVTIKK